MKHLMLISLVCFLLFACNNEPKSTAEKTDSTAKKEVLNYPFTAKYSLNWQPGDEKNALLVLNSLKKFVDGDVAGAVDAFADTVEFIADKFDFRGTKDSLKSIFKMQREMTSSMEVQPDTWLTVYYPDSNQTWVTIWYKQIWTDKKGKKDSAYLTDDILVGNNKILEIDEKQRLYPEAKPKK
jgi:uncharacterized protein YcfL